MYIYACNKRKSKNKSKKKVVVLQENERYLGEYGRKKGKGEMIYLSSQKLEKKKMSHTIKKESQQSGKRSL